MDTRSYKTRFANEATVQRAWHVVDAEGKTLAEAAKDVGLRGYEFGWLGNQIGVFITGDATFAAEEGGCMAECG